MRIFSTNLVIESKAGERVEIPLNNKVTILTGDSATGKTKLIKYIKLLITDSNEIKYASIADLSNKLIVCETKNDVLELIKKKVENKIIIIDRFDLMSNNEKIIQFMKRSSNIFIVASHKEFKQCGYSTDSMLGVKHDGVNYIAYKLFETPRDYMLERGELI